MERGGAVKRLRIPRLEPTGTRAKLRAWDKPRPAARYTADDSERSEREPWRRTGYGRAHRAERQRVAARQGGRCAYCGRVCAVFDGEKWRGGELHHETPLRRGGESNGRRVLLCTSCHRKADAALRRRESGA